MTPHPVDTMVRYQGSIYFVEEVLKIDDNPWYVITNTLIKGYATKRTIAAHSELTILGGVLIGEQHVW